jgi:hypothetical protein
MGFDPESTCDSREIKQKSGISTTNLQGSIVSFRPFRFFRVPLLLLI